MMSDDKHEAVKAKLNLERESPSRVVPSESMDLRHSSLASLVTGWTCGFEWNLLWIIRGLQMQ